MCILAKIWHSWLGFLLLLYYNAKSPEIFSSTNFLFLCHNVSVEHSLRPSRSSSSLQPALHCLSLLHSFCKFPFILSPYHPSFIVRFILHPPLASLFLFYFFHPKPLHLCPPRVWPPAIIFRAQFGLWLTKKLWKDQLKRQWPETFLQCGFEHERRKRTAFQM